MHLRFCFLLLALLATSVAAFASAKKPSFTATTEFSQYNATLFQYNGLPQVAQWGTVPFYQPIAQIIAFPAAPSSNGETPVLFVTTAGGLWTMKNGPVNATALAMRRKLRSTKGMQHAHLDPYQEPQFELTGPGSMGPGYFYAYKPNSSEMIAIHPRGVLFEFNISYTGVQVNILPSDGCRHSIRFAAGTTAVTGIGFALNPQPGNTFGRRMYVGTNNGLYSIDFPLGPNTTANPVPLKNTTGSLVTNNVISSVSCVPLENQLLGDFQGGACFVTEVTTYCTSNICPADTIHALMGYTEAEMHWHVYRIPGIVDAPPTAFVYDAGRKALHMPNAGCDSVLYSNGTFVRVSGQRGGLPMNSLTCGASHMHPSQPFDGNIWFGSTQGAMMQRQDGTWKYFFGPRWLPGEGFTTGMNVTAIAVGKTAHGSEEIAFVATDTGLSIIFSVTQSLADKAAAFQAMAARHDRFGLNSDASLGKFGDLRTLQTHETDNDGLWTSLYLASQCFRYAVTNEEEARQNAWNAFNGMRLLVNATGIPGYMARTVVYKPASNPGAHWFQSTTMPGFWWKGTTSSDEVTGHLHAYPLFHDLVAQTPDEKKQVLDIIDSITSNMVKNNFTLIGEGGVPTQWGHWDPASLNDTPFFYDDRGVNVNEFLAFLESAYRLTGKELYATAFNELVGTYGYAESMVNLKITQPGDVNFSDDELTFLPYLLHLWSSQPSPLMQENKLFESIKEQFITSLVRTYNYVKVEKPDLWGFIFAAIMENQHINNSTVGVGKSISDGLWCMETWPMSFITWSTNNSGRLDVVIDADASRGGQHASLNILPYDEISLLLWNGDPFELVQGNGMSEMSPSAWLYPYWLGRYFGFF